jgi:TM2 domain-containing membrane protein YozV
MAISVHCPNCHQRLDDMRQDCAHCGADLPPGVLNALALALGNTPMPSPGLSGERMPAHVTQPSSPLSSPSSEVPLPVHDSALRPWLAAALSLLCGLGQLYNGQTVKGIVLIALGTAAVLSSTLLVGKILALMVWPYAIVDAYLVARRLACQAPVSSRHL